QSYISYKLKVDNQSTIKTLLKERILMKENQNLLFNQIITVSCLGGFVLLSGVAAVIKIAQQLLM
ncbi:hypothetical protein, partial [Bacillus cereus group sp. BfR-BA-01395]|uniref:hypothetical protein n=1 Tax=Bacillus cereus group sp. BfR-BA-01395 TaxID=2920332 RepID=UPI001F5A1C30